jgi:capsular polysaccharide transport system permease protein
MQEEYGSSSLSSSLNIQKRVVGALIMREIHTRFGRNNIGYLWIVVEPMLLAIAVTLIHVKLQTRMPHGIYGASFWIVGYTPWCLFRSIVFRAEAAIDANRALFYHRNVTILDVHLARAVLDGGAVTFAMCILLFGAWILGDGNIPERPLLMIAGLVLLWVMAIGLGLIYSACAEMTTMAERFMHPFMYLILPFTGIFFMLQWMPTEYVNAMLWVPIPHVIELIREGQFAAYESPYIDIPYVLGWCLGLNLVGLLALRSIRHKIHL